ncbi:hypothetical protein JZ785_14380 [Alicyclobacillus curvatus]|nr:hypothetical protein JZ785_14380 [Alicyclobacillus curvatus]
MLVFRVLQDELEEAMQRATLSEYDNSVFMAEDWVELLERMVSWVESCTWLPKSPHKRELRAFLQAGCSYRKAAQKCKVSEQWLYSVVDRASSILEQRFYGVLKALRQRNIKAAEHEFRKATGEFPNLFESVIRNIYQPVQHESVELNSCSDELDFLQWVMGLEDDMVGLDRSRIEHLLYILFEGDPRYRVAREYLTQCVEGNWGVDETVELLTKYEASTRPILAEGED